MARDEYREWLALQSESAGEHFSRADARRLDELEEQSGLTFRARYDQESGRAAWASGSFQPEYMRPAFPRYKYTSKPFTRKADDGRRGTGHKHPPGPRRCPKCGV